MDSSNGFSYYQTSPALSSPYNYTGYNSSVDNSSRFQTSTPTSSRYTNYYNYDQNYYNSYSYPQYASYQQSPNSYYQQQYSSFNQQLPIASSTIDSAYSSGNQLTGFSSNSSLDNKSEKQIIDPTPITKVNSSRKRKHEDSNDTKNCEQIVEQIFTEAAIIAKQQKHQQQQHGQFNDITNSNASNKRPKILKLDEQNLEQQEILCKYCNLVFNSKAKLIMHEYKYHGNGSSTECPICFKKFGNQANALVHLRAHTQEKTYKCNQCDSAFCDSSTLKKHMRIHTGEKPYECQLCHKKFTQSGNLKRHLNVHKKYPAESEPQQQQQQQQDYVQQISNIQNFQFNYQHQDATSMPANYDQFNYY